ncbi:MAG: Flp pilus assembly complex ATPase component TadA [Burkholderiales bacterium]|nr:Flp pilus assembly complex ATPase component TadA [Burkholderiales bacterium]
MGLEPTTPRRDAPWLDDDRAAAVEARGAMDIDLGALEAVPSEVEDAPADGAAAAADTPSAPVKVVPDLGAPRPGRDGARRISSTSFERTQVLPPPSAVAAGASGAPAATLSIEPVSTPEALDRALAMQSRMPLVRIGEALLAMGSITAEQLQEALQAQRQDHSVPLGEMLVRRGVLSRETLRAALARKMGYPLVAVDVYPIDTSALVRVPHAVATRLRVLPLGLRGGRLVVATEDPTRRPALEELEFVVQASVVPVLAQHADLPLAISRAYGRIGSGDGSSRGAEEQSAEPVGGDLGDDASELLATLEQHSADRDAGDERPIEQSDNSLVRLINQMILEAQSQGVSDIHVECPPGREKVRIRFRKDGQLRLYLELPHTYRAAVIARLKIMCDLDISERRKPQDGKIAFGKFHPGSRLELRLATIPTQAGLEDAVLRLLASARLVPLDKLGLSPANLAGLKAAVDRPYGMVLCVGPTGSGKTTTLHAALGWINKPERKIWTAEDPIEITQPGLRQVQVNPKIDWTFAKALRAFLRADPDVVMVGEIRDDETAQVSIEASLTGHLVLSTLHTNSAAETITRLLDMGMDPFNFADSLLAVLAQRLLRRLCPKCVQTREASDAEVDEWLDDYLHAFADRDAAPSRDALRDDWARRLGKDGRLMRHHAPGCPACDGSGLKGRAAIHELLPISRELRRLIQTGGRAEQILAQAQREGMRTLRQDGIEKVIAGVTSIEEVRACSNA